ncbi:Protein-tyrosine sulfotransferase A [Taenia solium]|eukprot:TsM_000190000 transcript=TsM_000190000 gene=TsM_000190000
MRVLLDVHPSVRCGPETHILPHMLYLYSFKINPMFGRLHGANITHELVDSIFVRAISTLLHNTGPNAERLCAKDPFIDLCLKQLLHLYPKSQFILMVRDGRAVTNSVLRRRIRITSVDYSKPETVLEAWNKHYKHVLPDCINSSRCRVVRYEDLVLRPREQMKGILGWLGVPWDEVVLQHDQNMRGVNLPQLALAMFLGATFYSQKKRLFLQLLLFTASVYEPVEDGVETSNKNLDRADLLDNSVALHTFYINTTNELMLKSTSTDCHEIEADFITFEDRIPSDFLFKIEARLGQTFVICFR